MKLLERLTEEASVLNRLTGFNRRSYLTGLRSDDESGLVHPSCWRSPRHDEYLELHPDEEAAFMAWWEAEQDYQMALLKIAFDYRSEHGRELSWRWLLDAAQNHSNSWHSEGWRYLCDQVWGQSGWPKKWPWWSRWALRRIRRRQEKQALKRDK